MMSYYDDPKNVEQYINMADGYDGEELITVLRQHLPEQSSLLEVGMGPGKDVLLLSQYYRVTGSDASQVFVDRFNAQHPDHTALLLDAVTLNIDCTFDCIYSNKVLYQLTKDQLQQSFKRQAEILNGDGLLFHAFWYGDSEEHMHGLHFVYYVEATIQPLIGDDFELLEFTRYTEMEKDDSFYIILKRV